MSENEKHFRGIVKASDTKQFLKILQSTHFLLIFYPFSTHFLSNFNIQINANPRNFFQTHEAEKNSIEFRTKSIRRFSRFAFRSEFDWFIQQISSY